MYVINAVTCTCCAHVHVYSDDCVSFRYLWIFACTTNICNNTIHSIEKSFIHHTCLLYTYLRTVQACKNKHAFCCMCRACSSNTTQLMLFSCEQNIIRLWCLVAMYTQQLTLSPSAVYSCKYI